MRRCGARRCLLCNFLSGGYTEPHGEAARTRAHSGGCECQLLSAVQCYAAQDMMHIEGRRLSRQMTTTVCSAVRIYYLHYMMYYVHYVLIHYLHYVLLNYIMCFYITRRSQCRFRKDRGRKVYVIKSQKCLPRQKPHFPICLDILCMEH